MLTCRGRHDFGDRHLLLLIFKTVMRGLLPLALAIIKEEIHEKKFE